ncbi:aldehyde dehydrogenase family protein [Chondromyces crocatus]|uniref:Aldehyde dehydrogenase n=1 Tax=Chondromyces crocatus TaxID=52 RepID=A0A0K1EDE9_CHOCO|nr:aldehyde dehydrogenase family protein [Chondromyces crocatus]AKT38879.1 aldehyde dehydrogenase [Chondromyces crocatus]
MSDESSTARAAEAGDAGQRPPAKASKGSEGEAERGAGVSVQGGKAAAAKAALAFGEAWNYAPSIEARDHFTLQPRYELFIGGRWEQPSSGRYFDTVSPSTEEKLAEVAEADEKDVDRAVQAARVGYERYWSKLRPLDRGKYIYRIARILQEKARELAVVETLDGGKPIKESRDVDLPLAAAHFFYYAGWADKLAHAFPGRNPRPLGVAGQVIPWNFPLLMAAWKLAPALAAGNTCVLKPAETTPLTALLLAKIIEEADLPPGVVNVVTGAGATGAAVVQHAGVDKVAFTGSTEVGKRIQRSLAGTGKKLTLELGGKAANIVFEDAPLDQAIEGIIGAIFFNQGHVCCAGSRLLVEESIHDVLVRKLKDRMATMRVGDPLDKNTDVGAINSRAQLERIQEMVASGEREGATRYSLSCALPSRGYWFAPTFFTGVSQSHRIAREEIFGPVLSIMTFRTPDEAVEKANNTMYGLSAGVWTDKGSKSFWVAQRLRAGVVWANTFNKFDPSSPFGGYKESGFGREGGRQGLLAYLEVD